MNDKDTQLEDMKGVSIAMNQLFKEMLSDGVHVVSLLGGTSLSLITLAHTLGFDKEELKKRVCGDIDMVYYVEEKFTKEKMQ